MKAYRIVIGRRGQPRLSFEAMAPDAFTVVERHLDLALPGERVEVVAL